jgi:hypothetical protein
MRFQLATKIVAMLTVVLLPSVLSFPASAQDGSAPGFRLSDDRPKLDRQALQAAGLRIFQARHLLLVTDAAEADVQGLPELADSLFDSLQQQLPPLRPAQDDSDFQVTGFLMDAPERFTAAGLLPDGDFVIRHGRHLGYRFWMRNQTSAYYRRHLLLHEFIHCWMMCEAGMQDIPPLWFTEGIAEYFATHTINPPQFGLLPPQLNGFEGWGRVTLLHEQAFGKTGYPVEAVPSEPTGLTLKHVLYPTDNQFISDLRYAQAWALVWLLRTHPELTHRFAVINRVRSGRDFQNAFRTIDKATLERLAVVWLLMLDSLEEGFDQKRSFPELDPDWKSLRPGSPKTTLQIAADRGWQSSGIEAATELTLELTATGRCTVHDQPSPWVSEPQGITISYHRQRPLGELTAIVIPRTTTEPARRIPIGRTASITLPANSELWLQVNDSEATRGENSGHYEVQIRVTD